MVCILIEIYFQVQHWLQVVSSQKTSGFQGGHSGPYFRGSQYVEDKLKVDGTLNMTHSSSEVLKKKYTELKFCRAHMLLQPPRLRSGLPAVKFSPAAFSQPHR